MGAKKKTLNKRVTSNRKSSTIDEILGAEREAVFGGNRGGDKTAQAPENHDFKNGILSPIAAKLCDERLAMQLSDELPLYCTSEDFEKFISKIKINARLRLHLVRMKQQLEYMNTCNRIQREETERQRQRREQVEKEYSNFRDSSRQSAAVEFVKSIGQFLNSAQFMLHNLDMNSRGRSEEGSTYPAAHQVWDRVNVVNKCVDEKTEDARIRR